MSQKRCSFRRVWKDQINQFCDIWLQANNRAKKTVLAYRADLTQFASQIPASITPDLVSRATIEEWVANLQREQYAGNSIRRKLASLRAFFSYLVDLRLVTSSPLRELRIHVGGDRRLTRVVPPHDIRAIIRKVDELANRRSAKGLTPLRRLLRCRNSLIVRLLCVTGIRVSELVSLTIDSVRQQERTLLIHGKGSRERLAFIADRTTAALFDHYLKMRGRLFVDRMPLFTTVAGKSLTTESIRHLLRIVGTAAGASSRVTPHMLRHTAATALLENGADLRIVQAFLGHGSIRSTERYTHVTHRHLFRVLRRANPLKRIA